jgi:outer membrane receptor for ferrienterochelin and colicins
MIKISFAVIALLYAMTVTGQHTLKVKVVHADTKAPLAAATVRIQSIERSVTSDSTGMALFQNMAAGKFNVVVSYVGFAEKTVLVTIPFNGEVLEIQLEPAEGEEEEVIVQSTRTSRTVKNVPTRVETIEFEEIDEKNNMGPANVAMLLHESTGIQVQQTSATSANASIRIQGLDGRYTQLLKDGFANFGNFSSGLSVLEIPPLDLSQVEIIKGPASPLFGGGAIAGVINFISKTPKLKPEYNFIINYSNIGQINVGGYASQRGKKAGYSLLALYSSQKTYDVDDDDFTEVPKTKELTIHPKLFFYLNEHTTIQVGNSFTKGDRVGGDIYVVNGKSDAFHQYFEENKTTRNITTFELNKRIGEKKRLVIKQSFSVFDRSIKIPSYAFAGISYNAFSDVAYITNSGNHALVLGGNFVYDKFREKGNSNVNRDNIANTAGVYGQHTWDASEKIKLESGLRLDAVRYSNTTWSNTEFFLLPRISLLIKYNAKLTSRIGAGIGYKTPTLFTEETETIQYRNVAQINNVKSEKSYGGTADINYRANLAEGLSFSFNHMFFYTIINKPLILQADLLGNSSFINASKPVHSAGFETNAKFIFKNYFKLFLGYTFTDIKAKYLTGNQFLPLVPKHKLNTALIYEKEGVIKLGLEGYFTGRQHLSGGTTTPSFKEFGFMAEKIFKKFSLYINFENFTDTRQGRYKSVVNGSHLDPSFDEIWTHTEGFVVNGGIKIKL